MFLLVMPQALLQVRVSPRHEIGRAEPPPEEDHEQGRGPGDRGNLPDAEHGPTFLEDRLDHQVQIEPAPDEQQKALLKSVQKQVAECAADLGLAAETVASKRDLSAVIMGGDRASKVLNGWRRELVGDQLLELL